MRYCSQVPAHPLAAYVDYVWHLEDAPAHPLERIVPSGTVELVVNLHDDAITVSPASASPHAVRRAGAVLSGPYASYFVIDPRQHRAIMGVHFRPGAAGPFLGGLPAGELADAHVDLEAVWGTAARELRERLCAAPTPQRGFAIMEAALTARLNRAPTAHDAVPLALRALAADPRTPVRDVARRVGLSQRQLIAVFRAHVGLSPKLFARVERFQRSLAAARATPGRPQWAHLASRFGYADQSHLIRDYTAFCGLGPTDCLRNLRAPAKANHVPVIA